MTSATTHKRLRCVATRKDGQPCQAFASSPDGYCVMHSERAHEAHAKGGAATSNAERAAKALPHVLRGVSSFLVDAVVKVARKEYTPAQGAAMASIANALVHVYQASEFESRFRELEQMAADEGRFRDARGHERGPIRWGLSD